MRQLQFPLTSTILRDRCVQNADVFVLHSTRAAGLVVRIPRVYLASLLSPKPQSCFKYWSNGFLCQQLHKPFSKRVLELVCCSLSRNYLHFPRFTRDISQQNSSLTAGAVKIRQKRVHSLTCFSMHQGLLEYSHKAFWMLGTILSHTPLLRQHRTC